MITIHGNQYITVAERVQEAHKDDMFESLNTEVLNDNPVVIKATVTIKGRIYTGISAANPLKAIEKQSPYEVAETSAVGRALGFAGYGIVEGIATADEIIKAEASEDNGKCPKDGGKLIAGNTKTGKKFLKCENAKWDAIQHKNIGCDYVDWMNPVAIFDKNNPYKDGGMTKEQMEEFGA